MVCSKHESVCLFQHQLNDIFSWFFPSFSSFSLLSQFAAACCQSLDISGHVVCLYIIHFVQTYFSTFQQFHSLFNFDWFHFEGKNNAFILSQMANWFEVKLNVKVVVISNWCLNYKMKMIHNFIWLHVQSSISQKSYAIEHYVFLFEVFRVKNVENKNDYLLFFECLIARNLKCDSGQEHFIFEQR